MSIGGEELRDLKHAYQVIGVPLDASANSIKKAYRRLVRRWHPDLYPSGTTVHLEALQVTQLINEAYTAISHAPLRYYESTKEAPEGWQGLRSSTDATDSPNVEGIPGPDKLIARVEFWVRFVCGALFGSVVRLDVWIQVMPYYGLSPMLQAFGAAAVIAISGFAAVRYGDKFWHAVLRRWWLWP